MYSWVTHMHSHLGGECPHKCSYCYVQKNRFGVSPKYQGPVRLIEKELEVNYGKGKTIFVEHMNDLFAKGISDNWIGGILSHCKIYPDNTYVFQTKNTDRAARCFRDMDVFPRKFIMGTTVETNRDIPESRAPGTADRIIGIGRFKDAGLKTFITIEPIMDMDPGVFAAGIIMAKPDFVNIGADSKHCNLPEPSKEKLLEFIKILQDNKITILKKTNLSRLLK